MMLTYDEYINSRMGAFLSNPSLAVNSDLYQEYLNYTEFAMSPEVSTMDQDYMDYLDSLSYQPDLWADWGSTDNTPVADSGGLDAYYQSLDTPALPDLTYMSADAINNLYNNEPDVYWQLWDSGSDFSVSDLTAARADTSYTALLDQISADPTLNGYDFGAMTPDEIAAIPFKNTLPPALTTQSALSNILGGAMSGGGMTVGGSGTGGSKQSGEGMTLTQMADMLKKLMTGQTTSAQTGIGSAQLMTMMAAKQQQQQSSGLGSMLPWILGAGLVGVVLLKR